MNFNFFPSLFFDRTMLIVISNFFVVHRKLLTMVTIILVEDMNKHIDINRYTGINVVERKKERERKDQVVISCCHAQVCPIPTPHQVSLYFVWIELLDVYPLPSYIPPKYCPPWHDDDHHHHLKLDFLKIQLGSGQDPFNSYGFSCLTIKSEFDRYLPNMSTTI